MRTYLIGMLSGVMLATVFTFVFVIPANSDYWRMEIYRRGGGAFTIVFRPFTVFSIGGGAAGPSRLASLTPLV